MSKKEKKWRKIWLFIMVLIFGVLLPVELLEFIFYDIPLPVHFFYLPIVLPTMRKSHLNSIKEKEKQHFQA